MYAAEEDLDNIGEDALANGILARSCAVSSRHNNGVAVPHQATARFNRDYRTWEGHGRLP